MTFSSILQFQIHYRNSTQRAPYLLTPKKCGHPCKLQTLIEISHPLIPTDWVKECQMDTAKPTNFFVLKMHEHDDDQVDENNIDTTRIVLNYWDTTQPSSSWNPSALRKLQGKSFYLIL